ncbi:phage portal protein [Aliarcobacter butzleri]
MSVLNKIKNFFTAESTQGDSGAIDSIVAGLSAGQTITEQTALTLSTVWACTSLVSETIGTLPLHIYKKTANGRERADDYQLSYILRNKPNTKSTSSVLWQSTVASMLLRGNGILKKLTVGNKLVGLQFMPYDKLQIVLDFDGNAEFYEIRPRGTTVKIPTKDIVRIPNFTIDGNWGLSSITYGAKMFSNSLNSMESANRMLEKGLVQTVAFKTDKRIRGDQREDFKKSFEQYSGAMNSGKAILLEDGMDVKTISLNPKDAQLLESRAFSVEEICRWFRVDPSMIGHGNAVSNWGTGLEQKMIGFLTFTLRPILTRIEQAINNELIPLEDRGIYYAEFSIDGLLRGDSTARATFFREMVNAGIMTRDEVRKLENLPPLGGNAEKLMTNGATQPIDTLQGLN